jgi:hypothetical protein
VAADGGSSNVKTPPERAAAARIGCLTVAFFGLVQAQPSIALHPSVITDCTAAGLGQTTVQWSDPGGGQVQILVGSARVPFTGLLNNSGTASTGNWVSDGLPFALVDATGNQLASVTARVLCSPSGGPVAAGLAAASYFPLDVGNRWIYRTLTRFSATSYTQWLVTGAQTVNGQLWFVIQVDASGQMLMRQGDGGRLYVLQNGQSVLWLDPNTPQDSSAQLQVTSRGPQRNALGTFADGLNYTKSQPLSLETGTLVRGLGLTSSSSNVLAGSSGGFSDSLDLVEARIDGHLVFETAAPSVELSIEASAFDVTHGLVTNCILPCYFAACGLGGPQPDPPGTYKPCFRAGAKLSAVATTASVDLDVLDATGNVLAHTTMAFVPDDGGRSEGYQQMPLYTAPNQPFAPGTYRLRATAGTSSAILPFQVQ